MYKTTSEEVRLPQTAPKFAVIWSLGWKQPEIIKTDLAKPAKGISVLSKKSFFVRFSKLYDKLQCISEEKETFKTYGEAKKKATEYNVSKKVSV